jgi:hypothetical protein
LLFLLNGDASLSSLNLSSLNTLMRSQELLQHRLYNQGLRRTQFTDPAEVVRWFCAMQGQDYLGALWSVGQRLKKCLQKDIEASIERREIVRTWPMRGTLHFVAPEDVRWMLALLTPRVIARAKSIYAQQGLDEKTLKKGRSVIEKALEKKGRLTRPQVYDVLKEKGIAVTDQRGLHIIGYSAQNQSICFGPREGKQQTFVLLDDWIPKGRILTNEESVAEVTRRYFDAHGPASVQDLSWWTGLTLAEAKRGIGMITEELTSLKVDDIQYWWKPSETNTSKTLIVSLLSSFDEFIIGYKNRTHSFDPLTGKVLEKPKNGFYLPVILINGKIAGNWRRTFAKGEVKIEIMLFRKLTPSEEKALEIAVKRYRSFVDPGNDALTS